MDIVLVDCGSRRIGRLEDLLRGAGDAVVRVPLGEAGDAGLDAAGAVVISGGPHLFTGAGGAALAGRFAFVDGLRTPLLGICLGHQAIALRHGGGCFRGLARRGAEAVEVLVPHALVEGLGRRFELEADHCEGVDLPPGFAAIARSAHYGNEIMACGTAPVFGVQSHPETSGAPGRRLVEAFVEIARTTPSGPA